MCAVKEKQESQKQVMGKIEMEIKMATGGRKLLLVIACLEFEWQQGPHRLKGYVLAIFNKESGSQIFISCLA